MSEQEAIAELKRLTSQTDTEGAHCEADDLLLRFLRAHGFHDLAAAYETERQRVGFWYA